MKTPFLFPNAFKPVGWILFVPAFLLSVSISVFNIHTEDYLVCRVFAFANENFLGSVTNSFSFIENSIVDELCLLCLIVGGIFVCFSRLKNEDEFISKIRYESLVWATYCNYGIVLFLTFFIYGTPFLNVLFYNTFTLILFFIIRFHYKLYQLRKVSENEE
ncbi:MAG: hypothetical protein CFE23_01250 [Flavobacterium sp. BFFFF1]|uniref:hypothetical protein n=1 Tax=Flavobacterium sp. BFFFF1 TaxID=2015557 RepID=UPI000BDD8013|nr:hypothetical protein [Flavobacterium sp. BFFFF1]OYU81959.1 MAG: hypothetical protein CFE23_01250 [Flavobacterium sp. BFFFF1]